MIEAVLMMGGLGLVVGTGLAVASKAFYVYVDPLIEEVEGALPGANCGGCGFAGCAAAAAAVVNKKAKPGVCIVGGMDAASKVAAIMGMDPGTAEPLKALNACHGGIRAEDVFIYDGLRSCRALLAFYGGKRQCHVGCLGLGDCIKACMFNAIHMGTDGYPVVDETRCVGCGACQKACPKTILTVRTLSDRLLHFNQEDDAALGAQTCPAEIDIPGYIEYIRKKDYAGAVNTIRERNPLLLSCGRVCPHPCETKCRRGVADEPVSINQLKRFVADFEMNSGSRLPIACAPGTGKKVAVVGGGPAGLSCAYFLKRLGHDVTILDMMPELGGMIRYGIPEYRLPKAVLKWETDGILSLGIDHRPNVRMGNDFDVSTLKGEGFDAVFLGIGAWQDFPLRIEGENMTSCFTGIDFLTRFAQHQQSGKPEKAFPIGKKCAVIGGGNTAIDCVRTLVRLGAEDVYIVYRRTRSEMPANRVEIEAAEHEGVKFIFLAAPVRVIGDDSRRACQLEYLKMELGEPDASGRRRPVPVPGSETRIDLDMVIAAIGQGPDVSLKDNDPELSDMKITKWNTIDGDPETLQSNIPFVFAAGDAYTGASLVIEAIGGGRRAARAIHQYLNGQDVSPVPKSLRKKHIPESLFQTVPGVVPITRTPMPELPADERIQSFVESDLVITEADAQHESSRCLNCCRICYNPDSSC